VTDPFKPDFKDLKLPTDELQRRHKDDPTRYWGAADLLEDNEPPPPKSSPFDPQPPTDDKSDGAEGDARMPLGDADPDANEARNRAVVVIVGALLIAGLALSGWTFLRGSNPGAGGNQAAPSPSAQSAPVAPSAPPVKTSFLEIAGSAPLSGPIVVSNISCSVPAYDPSAFEIDADATIGGTKVLLTALTSGAALGLPAGNTYFDIHTDLAKSAGDITGWVSNQQIAIFNGRDSVTVAGHLLSGPVAGGVDVGQIYSTTLTCAG
jgi:hypothetical protein